MCKKSTCRNILVKIVHGFNKTSSAFELKAKFVKKEELPDVESIMFAKRKSTAFTNISLVIPFFDFVYKFIVVFNKLNL